jgi:hypothetical protein
MIQFDNTLCQLIQIGDFGKDPDDVFSLLNGYKVDAFIATLYPSDMRARLAKGVLKSLGRDHIPVFVGQNICEERLHVADYEFRFDVAESASVITDNDPVGQLLSSGEPTVVVVNAAMTDLAHFFRYTYDPSKHYIQGIIMQGGYLFDGETIVPNTAANNAFDMQSAQFCFAFIQSHGIPFYIVTRDFAYQYPLPASYSFLSDHRLANYLQSVTTEALEEHYQLCLHPSNHTKRQGLPNDRDAQWFFDYILDVPLPAILPERIANFVETVHTYDVFSTLFAMYPQKFDLKQINKHVHEIVPLHTLDYQSWIMEHSQSSLKMT